MIVRRTLTVVAVGLFAACWTLPALAGGGGHGVDCTSDAISPGDAPRVFVVDVCFSPNLTRIEAGQVVQWDLQASLPHTVTFADGKIDSGELSESFAVKFRKPGTHPYSCVIHPGMVGTVEVIGAEIDGLAMEVMEAGPSLARPTAVDAAAPSTDGVALDASEEAAAFATDSVPNSVTLRLDPLSGLLFVMFGLSVGAGATGAARVLRGR